MALSLAIVDDDWKFSNPVQLTSSAGMYQVAAAVSSWRLTDPSVYNRTKSPKVASIGLSQRGIGQPLDTLQTSLLKKPREAHMFRGLLKYEDDHARTISGVPN